MPFERLWPGECRCVWRPQDCGRPLRKAGAASGTMALAVLLRDFRWTPMGFPEGFRKPPPHQRAAIAKLISAGFRLIASVCGTCLAPFQDQAAKRAGGREKAVIRIPAIVDNRDLDFRNRKFAQIENHIRYQCFSLPFRKIRTIVVDG